MTDIEQRILTFAGEGDFSWDAVHTEFGWSPAAYYQALYRLIDRDDVLRADPVLVYRLRRIRDSRVGARQSRRFVA